MGKRILFIAPPFHFALVCASCYVAKKQTKKIRLLRPSSSIPSSFNKFQEFSLRSERVSRYTRTGTLYVFMADALVPQL